VNLDWADAVIGAVTTIPKVNRAMTAALLANFVRSRR
jgi:hypothetical protein